MSGSIRKSKPFFNQRPIGKHQVRHQYGTRRHHTPDLTFPTQKIKANRKLTDDMWGGDHQPIKTQKETKTKNNHMG